MDATKIVFLILGFALFLLRPDPQQPTQIQEITMCSSPAGTIVAGADGKFMTALDGWGTLKYAITTKNDSAQFYFNQGLSFYFGYHFTEAVASFKEASRFDPASAMTYW